MIKLLQRKSKKIEEPVQLAAPGEHVGTVLFYNGDELVDAAFARLEKRVEFDTHTWVSPHQRLVEELAGEVTKMVLETPDGCFEQDLYVGEGGWVDLHDGGGSMRPCR